MINKEEWRYALVVFIRNGFMEIIQKYPNTEQLETGYSYWKKRVAKRNVPYPVPIEFLDFEKSYRVLDDIISNEELNELIKSRVIWN